MTSQAHALLVDLFRAAPALALDLLRAIGVEAPSGEPHLVDSTFPVTSPDYHVDVAIACEAGGARVLVILVEVQLDVDPGKLHSWPLYQAAAHARFKVPACVLVVAVDERVAAWARQPHSLGPGGSVFRAIVLGPSLVPRVASAADPPAPELAVLSALVHGRDEPQEVRAAILAMATLEQERAEAYVDLLRYHLGTALDRALEAIMATSERRYLSDWANGYFDKGRDEGRLEGKAEGKVEAAAEQARAALLTVVRARGIELAPEQRVDIDSCADLATLDVWLARAARASTAAEIFVATT
jgi:hypothetical protein